MNDNAPVFSREIYEASVPETAPPNTPVIRLKVSDRDEGDNARVYIEIVGGNEGGEFMVNPETGVLYTAVLLDAEAKSLYTLTVSAIDQGEAGTRKQSSAKVKITVFDMNDNDPAFENEAMTVTISENGPSGDVVARVVARDADSGENAYISYSIANLHPVPFDVDHFSGTIRTTRLLDYESMRREYILRVRASDWGLPYRRQAEMRLTVRLKDVNDNRPQFERVDCVGYLPRRLPIGSEIVTLSAIDFDAGDVVSYRIIGGNEDNCFSLDSGTGVLTSACDLGDVRADSRILNVTATDGMHFADASTLTLHLAGGAAGALECRDTAVARRLTELLAAAERSNTLLDTMDELSLEPSRYGENLHAPEFVEFPIEVKVNESIALGTSLVRLQAQDRDHGYNGLLIFGISGGDPDSAFRIDPDTGELEVIGYLDRERESEYYLNVTVYDLGRPQRSSSRLLPITVLDVNDNPPRFEKTLASFRVTENALNGTAIFRANATDRDAGIFGRVSYSVSGADSGEFCIERDSGVLRVCASLDRERRALYELELRAVDGGGLHAQALVRVAVDDVNDNAPLFSLAAYSARVREDVPLGTLVAVVDAFDPDLGEGGLVTYSLSDQSTDDAMFTIDQTSGTLRIAKQLDFEEKQVYGVTVRACDAGRPELWSEASVVLEVLDVDENRHAPVFEEPVLAGAVREDAAVGSRVLAARAHDADPPGRDSRLAYSIVAGSGLAHFSIDDTGMIHTVTPLDRESTPHYWLTVCAEDQGLIPRLACVQVFVDILDVNDMVPWAERAAYFAAVPEHCAAGTSVARVLARDADAAPVPASITYSIVAGNPDGLFSIDERTGVVVTTGRSLDREAARAHALEVRCSDGALASTVRVHVALLDLNDHAPVFTQQAYDVHVPPAPPPPDRTLLTLQNDDAGDGDKDLGVGAEESGEGDENSPEWDGDEDEDGSGARPPWEAHEDRTPSDVYVTTVLALDPDAAENGTVRYAMRARGAARGLLRVHARTGRVGARRPLRPHEAHDVAVRACDGAKPVRCAVARVRARGARRGGGAPPTAMAPPPLQAAELDAPGFLLAVLQAADPDLDPLYYDIVDGDADHDFYVGREDGSLVLARRLLWERRPAYALNISITDGTYIIYVPVNITVINDANEGGVSFTLEEYVVDTSESTRVGEVLIALHASIGVAEAEAGSGSRLLFGLHAARAPASLALFKLHELSGVLELAQPLDRESAAEHELTVWARDQAPRASRAWSRVRVRVHGTDEHAPEWGRRLAEARLPRSAIAGTLVAPLRAADRDSGDGARLVYSLAGGDAAGLFTVDATLGDVRLARPLPALGPRDYTLHVRAANPPPAGRSSTLPLHVLIVEPDDSPPRFQVPEIECEVAENEPAGTTVATLEARSTSTVWLSLEGGDGMFRLNPAAGVLSTAAPLDFEARSFYNLTVTALNMGGGVARAAVRVHVADRNECAPRLGARSYRGRVSEAASAGALVGAAGAPGAEPLVLRVLDGDGPAQRARTFELHPPAAAALFRVDDTTGALRLRASLDYETARLHRFTVKVVDAGVPRLPAESTAEVVVEVVDVNDCPPRFGRATYEAELLLPTAEGVQVVAVSATDPDAPRGIAYDVLEEDAGGALALVGGALRVVRPDLAPGDRHLRVRASDGRYSATARVLVRVRQANNSGLAFHKPDYYGSVIENTTKVTTVAVLNVLGAALDEHIEFRILNPTDGFQVGRSSGAVRTTGRALDREARPAYTLLVQARSAGAGSPRVAHARLHVAVTDVNDNCPVFVERPYVAAVRAGAEPGTEVLRVHALDADADDNGEVRYEMKRGHGELFRVDRKTGQISLKQTVDTPNQLYNLVIAAFDGGVPACGAEADVAVRVWGGGAGPAWERARWTLAAREDAAPGTALGAVRARSPLARALLYTLVDAPEPPLFELHFDTGVLVATEALDYESAREHELVVRATDGVTGAYADAALSLRVIDVNDCAPSWERDEYHAAVSEAADLADLVLRVRATDDDSGPNGEIDYSLRSASEEAAPPFSIDEQGAVRVAAPLDAETSAVHHVLLVATDRGAPPLSTTAHLFVAVEDVNDCAPLMERSVFPALVSAEAARGTVVARVAAWDADARDAPRLRYAPAGAEGAGGGALLVDAHSGLVTVRDARALAGPRSLNVSVSDGAHAAFARLKLTPAAVNRYAPRFPHLVYEARAMENQPPPLLLTTVKAYDEDAGEYGAITYSIPSAALRESFSIDATSGALRTRVALDREARAEWRVPVTATDGGGLLRHTDVRVRVADENDHAPEFPLREYHAAPPPDHAPGAPFLTVTAVDADAGDFAALTYSLYEPASSAPDHPTAPKGFFTVDPRSGALAFAKNATEFEGRCVHVWVRARDGGGRAGEAAARVCVTRDAPRVAPPPPALFLREDAAPGTLLAELRAEPGSRVLRFRLAAATRPVEELFALDAAGRLSLAAQLDRETASQHLIGIVVESGSGSSAPAVLLQTTLHVLDVNEHAPVFHSQPYVVHVAENTPSNSALVQLMADDPDAGSNGEVRFSLSDEGSEAGSAALFSVDPYTGWVSTAAALDREARAEHRLTLVATDGGAARRSARGTLVVRLRDYNDCPPRLRAPAPAAVREDAPLGTVVVRLQVDDADLSAAPLVFLVAGGDPRARFHLRDSGELFVTRPLDRETEPRYELDVVATDGKFSTRTTVEVTVIDVNDNPPYCVSHRLRALLREDAQPGAPVGALQVRDADDAPADLRYFLTGENAHHFHIDQTGAITVAAALDREVVARYALAAGAQDRTRTAWGCRAELLVALADVNDNSPRFSADTYSVTLPEDADVGTLVAKVHASDADLGENRLVRYSFVEDTEGFSIAPDSGVITLRTALDREQRAEHRLAIRARDGGTPPRSATATVRLTVADVNDNPPEFELTVYRARVPELDAPGAEVLRVRTLSQDDGVNADVYYSLVGGDERDDFAIDRNTGAVTIARPLDYERRKEYFLTVQAVDGGTPPLSDLASLNISVIDSNDNAPVFSQATYSARVREDAPVGERVVQVIANDADDGVNGRISYSITLGDREGRFAVDADTGYVVVAAVLDRERTPTYSLRVRARDRGLPALDATALLAIEVLDANDNPPLFSQTNYTAVVREDRPLGHTILKFEVEDADAPPNSSPYTYDFQSGNEAGAFRLEQDGYLRSATLFNHRIKDRYVLQVRVFDNGTPPLYSDAWVYIKVIEESQYPPVVTPLEIVINSYLDEFAGGLIGRVYASDRDAYDILTYSVSPIDGVQYPLTDLFEIDGTDGTLRAAPRLDVGEYRLNVTVGDGKFLSFAIVRVTVVLISDEILARAIVVRFREVSDRDFVLSHRKGFVRAVREATDCEPSDVIVVSVQPSGEGLARRRRRQVAQDLDVAFGVRAPGGGFLAGDVLRRLLHAHLERLEERTRLVVEELVRGACGGCVHGTCAERLELRPGARVLAADVFALVAPPHRLRAECTCELGYGGERCDRAAGSCATAECGAARCEPAADAVGYKCCDAAECRAPPPVVHLAGDGYLLYRLERGVVDGERLLDDELTLSLRFRTRRERGTIAFAGGRVDYAVLEVAEGFVQFRMELGSGPALVRASVPVADGAWHEARLERRGATARLTVDRRSAHAQAPPPAAVLDVRADRLLLGAALHRHAHAQAPEQVTHGFYGCITELRLSGSLLPLEEGSLSEVGGGAGGGAGGRATLVQRVRVRAAPACPPLPPPTPCASYPCLNGGTCRETGNLVEQGDGGVGDGGGSEGYACSCHARFSGPQCEVDAEPCAAAPCLHGGRCSAAGLGGGYRCECAAGLAGTRCERGRWCRPGACEHGGACEEGEWGPSCRCRGYFGPRCQYDVDECAGEPCLNGATCLNEPGSFRCVCPPDKTGMNCGNPLYSDAVVAGGVGGPGGARSLRDVWRWARAERWPLWAAGAALALLVALCAALPLALRARARVPPASPPTDKPRPSKLSNLEAVRRAAPRPNSCADPPPLNNIDTLRSYGSAGDELEGIPPDYLRNLNIDPPDRKPWSEQMHLHTFVDNKIYNDLKACKPAVRMVVPGGGVGIGAEPHLVGGYHWDCSDWCGAGGGALPGISEVAGSERPDSSSPPPVSPPARRATAAAPATMPLLSSGEERDESPAPRLRLRRDPDAASLISMLEEQHSLLGDAGSCSDLSANLCEIEESDAEEVCPPQGPPATRHTAV